MVKRILLFMLTNVAVVVTISIILSLLGVRPGDGLVPMAIFCFVWGMGGAFISLAISRWMAKRAMGVKLVDGNTGNPDADWLYRTVERLAQQAQLPMPEVGIYESPEVNAFATGPSKKRSLVAVSTGILRSMKRNELEAVLAHEVSHIGNGDMVTMTLLQGVVNAFVMFIARIVASVVASNSRDERGSSMLYFVVRMVAEIVLGFAGMLVTSWFSRHREFRADEGGAALAGTGNMVAALERLGAVPQTVDPRAPALASFKIAGGARGLMALFSTHPPLEDRIQALRNR
ncbi:MAG: protease HtpX [Vicinamibacteria bacterium]|jgi:heat shock protein HtpX|nr:protease HtpX [Vicinamibacteria bacterium]